MRTCIRVGCDEDDGRRDAGLEWFYGRGGAFHYGASCSGGLKLRLSDGLCEPSIHPEGGWIEEDSCVFGLFDAALGRLPHRDGADIDACSTRSA
jgi:hypothetical protein